MLKSVAKTLAGAALAIGLGFAPVHAQFQGPRSFDVVPGPEAGTVVFVWSGNVQPGMAHEIANAFATWRDRSTRIIFSINSLGGSVREGDAVIEVFREIKKTHRFDTHVGRGRQCGSMCVPLYLQGQRRLGARTSSWLFHEIANFNDKGELVMLLPERTDAFFNNYFKPVGVPETWINQVKVQIKGNDLWQTGDDLIKVGANIITDPLENLNMRTVLNQPAPNQSQTQPIAQPQPRPSTPPTTTAQPRPSTPPTTAAQPRPTQRTQRTQTVRLPEPTIDAAPIQMTEQTQPPSEPAQRRPLPPGTGTGT